ncbi:efflux RND transporter periplasmic adaptor subunit [Arsukibacterium sp.]|uniref:efflux RND transporter periplasmic adaptor subunit n=1 Tax=Arsukibacterium sp. TaxID=1977258 RepID=UPI00299D0B64|nr:efflux RND transporter periplasmic adaptor subunit [Arsukibacterium sp.]MDX1537258.1 efflux RND transporter periplasmic adaptor subunit [Arsukibacterium sp.]
MNTLTKILLSATVGALIGASVVWLLNSPNDSETTAAGGDRKPLYWVAPMDPNYKRDKPGKSPMGMDLIPVFEDGAGEDEAGTIKISPEVINNLGVRTAEVQRGQLDLQVNTVGYVQYDENQLVHVSPRVEGWIERLYTKAAGDPVVQDEPLFALYSPTLVNAQEELLLALKRNNRVLIDAATERLLALQLAKEDIEKLKKTLKVSRTITINSPQSGVVDNLAVREGMYVKPGMSLMSIGKLEHIWIIGEVFERQASLIGEGDPVTVRLDYVPGREWQGKIDYVYPSLDTQTRTAQIRVGLPNPDVVLKPGMFAQLFIETQSEAEALLIPREALIRTGSQSRVVLALGEGKFKSIAVTVGRIAEQQVEILTGLNEGEHIVTSAQFLIDSESSKTSDFLRMTQYEQESDEHNYNAEPANLKQPVWVAARIVGVMAEHRMLSLEHEAIPEWQWPAMTMDFFVADAVDMDELKQGMHLHVQIINNNNGEYQISLVHIPDDQGNENMPTEMDHGDMSMPEHREQRGMNHGEHDQKEHNHD